MATAQQWNSFDGRVQADDWDGAFNVLEVIVKDIDFRLKSQENKMTALQTKVADLEARVVALENA